MMVEVEKPNTKNGKRSNICIFTIIVAFMLLIVLAPISASARTIYVDDDRVQYPSADYTGSSGLWDAVNNASSGDTVMVYPGIYKPPFGASFTDWVLHVNRSMIIRGVNRPRIDANGFNDILGRTYKRAGLYYYGPIANGLISLESYDVNINGFEFNNFSIPILTTITVSPSSGSYYQNNFPIQNFTVTLTDQFGLPFTAPVTLTWISNNPAVLTINSTTGYATPGAVGTAVITATSGTVRGNSTITLMPAPTPTPTPTPGGRRGR